MTTIGRRPAVVAGVDASQASRAAVRWAAGEAARRDSPLKLIHIHSEQDDFAMGQDNLTAASVAWEAEPGVPTEHELRRGAIADQLVTASKTAQLLVLGTHGFGALRGTPIGSVAEDVAGRAWCPVVVVRGLTPGRGGVVVGVDPSGNSERALVFALDTALARNTGLVVVHAWDDSVLEAGADLATVEAAEERALEDRIGAWRGKYPGVGIRLEVVRDRNVARALIRVIPDAGLIVIGSNGTGLGTTAHALLSRARCPVALVREPPPPSGPAAEVHD